MFDTHCHLNFKAFAGKVDQVINRARDAGVDYFVVPGTDVETSQKAIEITEKFEGVYAAVGIHPHHVYKLYSNVILGSESDSRIDSGQARMTNALNEIEKLLSHHKVIAVGEVGLDRHVYKNTKYKNYDIYPEFIEGQKIFFLEQLKLASKYKKTLIIHSREAKKDLLNLLTDNRQLITEYRTVFHCCEPDFVETGHALSLLDFAKKYRIYIGIDGDVTYWKEKQDFVREIPLDLLVLETDSPLLLPKPLRSQKKFPNEPKNLKIISAFIANIKGISEEKLAYITEENSKKLFRIV